MLRCLEVEFLSLSANCVALSSICAAPFSNMCSTQADNNSRKLRLRCGCQFPWCALALIVTCCYELHKSPINPINNPNPVSNHWHAIIPFSTDLSKVFQHKLRISRFIFISHVHFPCIMYVTRSIWYSYKVRFWGQNETRGLRACSSPLKTFMKFC
jgi:hypothetical protein